MILELEVTEEDVEKFRRLDQFLSDKLEDVSRTEIKSLFEADRISCDSQKLALKKMPPVGSLIKVDKPEIAETTLEAQNIPLDILYEDEHLVFVHKPQGLVVHPAPGHPDGTLVNAILYHCPDIEGVGDEKRPGIVHRLDKGTSGVMVVAKNTKCHRLLVEKFAEHDLERRYEAITMGREMPVGGTLKSMIGRHNTHRQRMSTKTRSNPKEAITHYKLLGRKENLNLVECKLETGRTHQIRVHLTELLNNPLLGDEMYGNVKTQLNLLPDALKETPLEAPYLHAKLLALVHPITGQELRYEVPPPKHFQDLKNFILNPDRI
jgi:23S rRNA pseudouridine1911/1915/1917 synthase